MAFSVRRLRTWFALAFVALLLVVGGFYAARRYESRLIGKIAAKKLGVEVQQSTEGFSFSKSAGGRTLFKISARKATQFKASGRAILQDVNIVVYGKDSSRFDQIYGSSFEYDSRTGDIKANGEVDIDLEANAEGPRRADQAVPSELKNPIHLKTSGLVFNQKSGLAHTDELIQLRVQEASGSARGADYDSESNRLTLRSDIHVETTGSVHRVLTAKRGMLTKDPKVATLESVVLQQPDSVVRADVILVDFRGDNTIQQVRAVGHVEVDGGGISSYQIAAAKGDLQFGPANDVRTATLSDGAQFRAMSERPLHGSAGHITTSFDTKMVPRTVRLSNDAHFVQEQSGSGSNASQNRSELNADAIDVQLRDGKIPKTAMTSGKAEINIIQPASQEGKFTTTTVSATRFVANFNKSGRLDRVVGDKQARVVSRTEGQPDKTSTSDVLEVIYAASGDLDSVVQRGHFTYREPQDDAHGERLATGDFARYTSKDDVLSLNGNPRIAEGGMSLTSNTVRIDRKTGEATADGNVKSTYTQLTPQENGAMLAASDPIHVTARRMTALNNTGVAQYTGGARLWQGANIVQAPVIEFDRQHRSLIAQGSAQNSGRVISVFMQQGKDGKAIPVNVTAKKLSYVDGKRRARFEGGVTARNADGTISADHIDIFLKQAADGSLDKAQPSQLDRIIAEGKVVLSQPGRRGSGNALSYFQEDGRFVLSGGSPSVTDEQHGTVRGDSLTFFSRDDRVLIEGSSAAPTVTHTRVTR